MLVIRNAKIYTCAGKIYEQADILIDGQKIAAIGENLDVPPQTKSIDADGLVAMPGIVDAHSHVGLFGDGSGAGRQRNDRQCHTRGGILLRN